MDAATTARIRKAYALATTGGVERLGGSRFAVRGTRQPWYYVDLDQETPCYCLDVEHRSKGVEQFHCKHHLAARLAAFDSELLEIVAGWLVEEAA
jgi:hypothetical protein